MYIKNELRYNPQFPLVIDDITYASFDQLRAFPEVMAAQGISEISVPWLTYDPDKSILNEIDHAPYFVLTARDPEQVVQAKSVRARDAAQRYLDSTEYLFNMDRGTELVEKEPARAAELRAKRAEAREVIRAHKLAYPEVF